MTKTLNSTAVYAWTTLISCLICVPWALWAEGPTLAAGAEAAIAKVGAQRFYLDLVGVGLLYHLYNQVREGTVAVYQCVVCWGRMSLAAISCTWREQTARLL